MAGKTTDAGGIETVLTGVLEGYPAVEVALLFGSVACGRATAGSDVDVAVAARRPLPLDERVDLQAAMSAAVGREVDLVDLQAVSGPLLAEAMTGGRVLRKDNDLYAELIKKMWFNQADMMPLVRMILEQRRRRIADGR